MWEPKMYSGWMMSTVVTEDKSLSAHYENTILITDGKPGDPFSDRRGKESRIFKSLLTTGKWKKESIQEERKLCQKQMLLKWKA